MAGFEGRHGLLPCVKDQTCCVLEPGCVLRSALIEAENAMYGVLERLSIADILQGNAPQRSGGIYNLTIRGRSGALAAACDLAINSAPAALVPASAGASA